MRKIIDFNTNWSFHKKWSDKLIESFLENENITIPHISEEIPIRYFDEKKTYIVSGYQNIIKYSEEFKNKRVIVNFEGVSSVSEVFINSKKIKEHFCGFTPFNLDITNYLKNGDNLITVKVDSRERKDTPPFGGSIDYLCYGGIYRECYIEVVNDISVENLMLMGTANKEVHGKITLRNSAKKTDNVCVSLMVFDKDKKIHISEVNINLKGSLFEEAQVLIDLNNYDIKLWDIESPKLYIVKAVIKDKNYEDEKKVRIGFRDALFTEEGFFLNGKKLLLRGLNRHQSFPYYGYAMPERAQKKDADILKYDLSLNIVRCSHYPQSKHFLDRCDEIGLLVFEELPGWQHIGDKKWQERSVQNVHDMIVSHYHHPSIIIWGVRINESSDSHDFYKKTNAVARSLDKIRQTGGVRYNEGSEFLEDVYTINDFYHNGVTEGIRSQKQVTRLDKSVPYMITEYNGHMFPTKIYDDEPHQHEHSLRHYRVINSIALDKKISGSTGWCAFDYNTHFEYGSGDRICYHGVYDIFRNPKFAASCYASQTEPSKKVVLDVHTYWVRGDRPVGGFLPLLISTNCDYIELYFGKKMLIKAYPSTNKFQGLKYPPVYIESIAQFDTLKWEGGKVFGYINGKKVIEKYFSKEVIFADLLLTADDTKIKSVKNGSAWDTTRVTVKAIDSVGNRLPYMNAVIEIDLNGGGVLIGDDKVSLEGGIYSFWVKSTEEKKPIEITIKTKRMKDKKIVIDVE